MSIRRLFATLFAIALFTMAVRETLDPDMWWHLKTGQYVWEQGIPREDPFSFTRLGVPWVAHEWLSDAIMWGVYQAAGLVGLSLFFAAIIALTFWLLYQRCAGKPYLAAFVILLAAVSSAPTWGARPQMLNTLFLAIFVNIMEGYRAGQVGRKGLYALPLLTLMWANLHSGYLLGVVVLGGYVVGEGVQVAISRQPTLRGADATAVSNEQLTVNSKQLTVNS